MSIKTSIRSDGSPSIILDEEAVLLISDKTIIGIWYELGKPDVLYLVFPDSHTPTRYNRGGELAKWTLHNYNVPYLLNDILFLTMEMKVKVRIFA